MKTVRFGSVIEACGRPEVHLLLLDPKKDPDFQRALKADRVLTAHHAPGKTDFGAVGYDPDARGQLLIFPRSLKKFASVRVIGLDYDLLKEDHLPVKRTPQHQAKISRDSTSKRSLGPKPKSKLEEPSSSPAKVIPFTKSAPILDAEEEESDEVAELKTTIRRALKALESGKEVAAYNILKRVTE